MSTRKLNHYSDSLTADQVAAGMNTLMNNERRLWVPPSECDATVLASRFA